MKRLFLLGTVACTVCLFSCSKEKTVTVKEIVYPNGQVNADSLTAAVTVGYATKVADANFPASSTSADAPKLDSIFNGSYVALRGGLLTIYPANVSGYVQGYYVQIVGAKSYFKIDYPAGEAARKQEKARLAKNDQEAAKGYGEGNIDGTIAFTLPAAINGDTFYVKYAAYDKDNRVSQSVTSLVVVEDRAAAGITDSLQGKWRRVGYAYYNYGQVQDYGADTLSTYGMGTYYDCVDNKLEVGNTKLVYSNSTTYNRGYSFNGNKAQEFYGYTYGSFDLESSTCDNIVYKATDETYSSTNDIMGFTFDANSRRITLFYTNASYSTYRISKLTSKELVLAYTYMGDEASTTLINYIKQ